MLRSIIYITNLLLIKGEEPQNGVGQSDFSLGFFGIRFCKRPIYLGDYEANVFHGHCVPKVEQVGVSGL